MPTALRLTDSLETATISAKPVYELKINYLDNTTEIVAVALVGGIPTVIPYNENWIRDVNGELLFDVNGELLEADD